MSNRDVKRSEVLIGGNGIRIEKQLVNKQLNLANLLVSSTSRNWKTRVLPRRVIAQLGDLESDQVHRQNVVFPLFHI